MSDTELSVVIAKEALKFAAAHMTIFPDGSKERLHGHNYRVEIEIGLRPISFHRMIGFAAFKQHVKALCEAWDERVLVAVHNPHVHVVRQDGREFEFTACGQRYVLPQDEVVILERDNISAEVLASEFCARFSALLGKEERSQVTWVSVGIFETAGQGARCRQQW